MAASTVTKPAAPIVMVDVIIVSQVNVEFTQGLHSNIVASATYKSDSKMQRAYFSLSYARSKLHRFWVSEISTN